MAKLPIISIVSDEEAEEAEFVVCLRAAEDPKAFTDNEHGACAHCGEGIIYRPYMPKRPPKICLQCAGDLANRGLA